MSRGFEFSFEVDPAEDRVQSLVPPDPSQRFEGIGFSPDGNVLGVVTSDTNAVYCYRKQADGTFEQSPFHSIIGPATRLDYPHDLSFSRAGHAELARSGAARRSYRSSKIIQFRLATRDFKCRTVSVSICTRISKK